MDLFFKLRNTIKRTISFPYWKLIALSFLVVPVLVSSAALGQNTLAQPSTERFFNSGIDLLNKKQYGAALENFNQFLNSGGGAEVQNSDAQYYRALCAINLYHSDAEKKMADFVRANPSSSKAAFGYFDLANFFYNNKNYKKAITNFEKVEFDPLPNSLQQEARFKWGYSYFNQKQIKEALDQFNFVKSTGGQYGPAASYYAGFVEYSQADFDNALVDLKRADQSESYNTIVPYLIANVYNSQRDYNSLISYVPTIINREGLANASDIQLLVAEAHYKKKDFQNALASYDKNLAGKVATANKGVLLKAGYAAFTLGQGDKALEYLKASFADNDSVGFYSAYYLGQLYLKSRQKPMALTSFDIARKYSPDQQLVEEASFQYAKVAYELGQPDRAITEMEKLRVKFPKSEHQQEIRELLSQAYVNANNYNKAIEHIESLPQRGAVVNRAFQKATLLKGMELFNLENYSFAIDYFQKSLAYPIEEGYTIEANFWAGEAYSIQRKADQAINSYLKVIDLAPNGNQFRTKARYGLGYCFFNNKEYDRALFNFKEFVAQASTTQPNLADGTLRLADCYYVSKSYSDALTNYKKAIQLNTPDGDYAHMQAGVIHGILRQYPEAEQELNVSISKYPNRQYHDEAQFQLAQLAFEQGKYQEAVNGYSKLISNSPSSRFTPYAYVRRAASYFNLKEYSKTSDDYITVIDKYGNHPASKDVLIPLQEALNLVGRSSEFDKYLAVYKTANPDAKGVESIEFEAAKNFFFNQDYAKAKSSLQNFVASYPQSAKLSEARYYVAESMYRLKEFGAALPIYYELSADRTNQFYNKEIGRISELEFKSGNHAKAIIAYAELAKVASNKKDMATAWNGLMESNFLLGNYDSTQLYAQKILSHGSVNASAQNKASLFLGKASMAKGDFESAKDEFLTTINSAKDDYSAEAKYLLAEVFYKTKEYKQCYETLVSLNSDFASFTPWVGKSYLLLSDYYLAIGNRYQTRATLQSLTDFPLNDIKETAMARLKALDAEDLKKNPVPNDSTDDK